MPGKYASENFMDYGKYLQFQKSEGIGRVHIKKSEKLLQGAK